MHSRPFIVLLNSVLAAAALLSPVRSAAAEAKFDFEARKQKQAWLWEAPKRQVPPAVKDERWPLGAEDRFILRRLEDAGLSPAPAADDRTWLRRVHFALTGLPPGLDEVSVFLADTQPGARGRVVERLLASPHFGERWARHWMDLMRYAESRGHEGDYTIANAWHYRDYLVLAFNADVPYDRLLVEHLAGDLVPEPRLRPGTDINESVVATGWAFLGEENHSPVDIRQDECERVDNKIDVFSKTFLGLTVSCARCHDHKFDPIRAQDYYAMSGFFLGSGFRQVRFEAMENNRKMAAELTDLRRRSVPGITREIAEANRPGLGKVAEMLVAARDVLADASPSAVGTVARKHSLDAERLGLWVARLRDATTHSADPLHLLATGSSSVASVATAAGLPAGARVVADFTGPGRQPWKVDGEAFGPGPVAAGEIILAHGTNGPVARVMRHGAARRDLFWSRLKTTPGNEDDSGRLAATSRSGQTLSTPTVTLGAGKLHYLMRGKARVYAAVDSHIMLEGPLHGRLVQKFDSGPGAGPRWLTHDLTDYSGHRTHLEFGPDGDAELEVLMVVESATTPGWLPAGAAGGSTSVSSADLPGEIQRALIDANEALARGTVKSPALTDWLLRDPGLFRSGSDAGIRRAADAYLAAQDDIAHRVRWESRTAVAFSDGTGVDENILTRGRPNQPGAVSPRSLPVVFASARPVATTASSGRDELAGQLVAPSNPMVARVIVNRVWHHLFGRGLVASVDNFGALGDRPSHPELLDHLAWRFVHEDGWSLKRLIGRLVLTRTFAMESRAGDARAEEQDPSGVLLHRMPVRRLEGEVIRDALLAVSGRLDPAVGGPPVAIHLTEFLVGRGRPDKSGPLDGGGRRSLYTSLRRNFLPTLMQTFDTPTPFSTVGKRNVTNVPAQSLALMNDELFHEQARVWSRRLLRETPGAGDLERVRRMFGAAYAREPSPTETADCIAALGELRGLHRGGADPVGEVWAELCHALLNANDFIYVK